MKILGMIKVMENNQHLMTILSTIRQWKISFENEMKLTTATSQRNTASATEGRRRYKSERSLY